MQTQQSRYSETGFADFNSAMMRAAVSGESSAQTQRRGSRENRRDNQAGACNNRNLSSIISRITDDGPAGLQIDDDVNHIQDSRPIRAHQPAQTAADRSASGVSSEGANPYMFAQSFDFDDTARGAGAKAASRRRSPLWQQFAMMLLVAVIAVMGFLVYELKMQTEEMKLALHSSQEQMRQKTSVQAQSSDVLPRLNSMNKALSDLKQEMHGIKRGYQQSDNKLALEIPRDLEPRLLEIAAASEIVTVLQDEFERIQHEVNEMGSELNVIRKEISPAPEAVAHRSETSAQPNPDIPNLVVNLASLTSRDKALAAVDTLQQAGVSPRIQQVMVNGKIVFRISVDGFTSRDAASAFIAEAKSKYGFDGGWIRRI